MNRSNLLIPRGRNLPTARQQNGLATRMLRSRIIGAIYQPKASAPFPFPWQVTARRFQKNATSGLNPATTWVINVAPATINDALPSIPYLRSSDPRGWQPPTGYVEQALPPGSVKDPVYIDRDLLDDPGNPPFLTVQDPLSSATANDFLQIADSERLSLAPSFCNASDWKLELWRSHVILSSETPSVSPLNPALPPIRLLRQRLYTINALADNIGGQGGDGAGGWIEIATLWLLRDAKTQATSIQVRQQVWWSLQGRIFQPGAQLAQAFGDAVDSILSGTAYAEFWSG